MIIYSTLPNYADGEGFFVTDTLSQARHHALSYHRTFDAACDALARVDPNGRRFTIEANYSINFDCHTELRRQSQQFVNDCIAEMAAQPVADDTDLQEEEL